MEAVVVLVTELQLLSLNVYQLHLVGRPEPDVRALAGVDVSDDRLNKCAQVSWGAMVDLEHNGTVAVVLNGHSFSEIVSGGHGWITLKLLHR